MLSCNYKYRNAFAAYIDLKTSSGTWTWNLELDGRAFSLSLSLLVPKVPNNLLYTSLWIYVTTFEIELF